MKEDYKKDNIIYWIEEGIKTKNIWDCIFYIKLPQHIKYLDLENNKILNEVKNILRRNHTMYDYNSNVDGSWDLSEYWIKTDNFDAVVSYRGVFPIQWNIDDLIKLINFYLDGKIIINVSKHKK